jgi:hypothetical protein
MTATLIITLAAFLTVFGMTYQYPNNHAPTRVEITSDQNTLTTNAVGQLQTNPGFRGLVLTIVLGTVSGTSPTLTVGIFQSYDGVNLINWVTSSAIGVATGGIIRILLYPSASLALGAGGTASVAVTLPAPPQFAIDYIVGGTTPSIQISKVWIDYLV